MSGHSRWAGIKHKKGAADAKRGKVFTRIVRELTIAAKGGGGNPDNNPRLRKAIGDAKAANMPGDNVKKAIARGTGEIPGVVFEEVSYEGYGPGGVAVYLTGTTDNRNRTSSEIRKIFSSHAGNLGSPGSVAYLFSAKGIISVEKSAWPDEEKLMSLAIDAGSEDFKSEDAEIFEIFTTPADFDKVKSALEAAKVPLANAEVTMLPSTYIALAGSEAESMIALMNELEEHDDVKEVFNNADIPKDIMEKVG
jgi:YebC/PmpR family DNA-binding regulatory protein